MSKSINVWPPQWISIFSMNIFFSDGPHSSALHTSGNICLFSHLYLKNFSKESWNQKCSHHGDITTSNWSVNIYWLGQWLWHFSEKWVLCSLASNDLFQIVSSSYTTFLSFAMHVLASFLWIINFILRYQCLLCSGVGI